MPTYDFELTTVSQILENDTILTQALLFPERSFYGDNLNQTRIFARNYAKALIQKIPPIDLHRHQLAGVPEISEIIFEMEPTRKTPSWIEPVELKFHVVKWKHADEAIVAYVPALDIVVLGEKPEKFDELVRSHIKFALFRKKAAISLWQLSQLQRTQDLQVDQMSFKPVLPTPKQRKKGKEDRRSQKKGERSILSEIGIDLTKDSFSRAYEVEEILNRIADALTGAKKRSILLVGPSSVGKTAMVHELVRRRQEFKLGQNPFWSTSGSRLIAGMSGFGMWEERCQKLCKEASKTGAILHMGGVMELMEVGKSLYSNIGIASFLMPYMVRGDIILIAECTPSQLTVIERSDPHLLEAFHQIEVKEPSRETGKAILLSFALDQVRKEPVIDDEALDLLDRLHRRYATYSAYPGRPLRFLDNLIKDLSFGSSITAKDVSSSFSGETGLPLAFIDDSVPLDPEETTQWLKERVIGQHEAVQHVVDLLCVVKLRLARPRKPLTSMLFIGPTGVGKTEMAKALAEFMFGDRNRMVRFDMSEFGDPAGAMRLISGGEDSEGRLTARVREQPFSVILLDEFEKAHPDVFDLLLQVLGEGRLTDAKGRLADFCNAIIIMTSNLGAESFQKGEIGFAEGIDAQDRSRRHFSSEVRKFLRPEMFNRIDAIVPFSPLDRDTVRRIAKKELDMVTRRDGIQLRNLDAGIGEGVADWLAIRGFNPLYGARPLKRTLEQDLVVPLAHRLNTYPEDVELKALLDVKESGISVEVSVIDPGREGKGPPTVSARNIKEMVERCGSLRRLIQELEAVPAVIEIENEVYRLGRRMEKRRKKILRKVYGTKEDKEVEARLSFLEDIMKRLESLEEKAVFLEETFLLSVYEKKPIEEQRISSRLISIHGELGSLLRPIYKTTFKEPDDVTLAVFGQDLSYLLRLGEAYFLLARGIIGSKIDMVTLHPGHSEEKGRRVIALEKVMDPKAFFSRPAEKLIGLAIGIHADMAYPMFSPERGWHTFKEKRKSYKCFVHTSGVRLEDYAPPRGVDVVGGIKSPVKKRTYDYNSREAHDLVLGKRFRFLQDDLRPVIREAMDACLESEMESHLGIQKVKLQ